MDILNIIKLHIFDFSTRIIRYSQRYYYHIYSFFLIWNMNSTSSVQHLPKSHTKESMYKSPNKGAGEIAQWNLSSIPKNQHIKVTPQHSPLTLTHALLSMCPPHTTHRDTYTYNFLNTNCSRNNHTQIMLYAKLDSD